MFEEVGIKIEGLKKIGQFTNTKEYKHDTVTVFATKCEQECTITSDPVEIAEAKWFDEHNLPTMSENAHIIMAMVK
ncbi:MAG: NUDIX domain-containing protein [Minisyncoccota bacterium]